MNSPRYRPAGLMVSWAGHRVMLDGGDGADPGAPVIRRRANELSLRPHIGSFAANCVRRARRLLCGGQTRVSNDRHSRPTAQNDSLPASTAMGGKHVGPSFRCAVSAPGGVAVDCVEDPLDRRGHCQEAMGPTSANNCAASMGTFTAPTRRGGRSSIRESCLTRCPLLRTGRAWGCQWFDVRGHWMGHSDWFERASIWPHRHQVSNGVFLDGRRSSVVLGRSCSRPRSSSRPHRPR